VDYKKQIRFSQECKKAFVLKILLRQISFYFQREMTITILKKKRRQPLTMHTTASEAMRLTCVYAGTFRTII